MTVHHDNAMKSLTWKVALTGLVIPLSCGGNAAVGPGGTGAASAGSGGSGAVAGNGHTGAGASGGSDPFDNSPECSVSTDCTVVNNCCNCQGIAVTEPPPICDDSNCKASVCELFGLPKPPGGCSVGQCVAGFDCDTSKVLCESLPPPCGPDETISVDGICWGPCVPSAECAFVSGCDACTKGSQVCVTESTQLGTFAHCVDIPSDCQGQANCACMGGAVCVAPFDTCADNDAGKIACSCPTC